MRTDVWYPLIGLLVVANLIQLTTATVSLPSVIQPWVTWGGGVLAAGLALTSGLYATRGTWIERILVAVLNLHPVVKLAVGLAFVVLVWRITLAAVPDRWVSVALTGGLTWAAFVLPLLAQHALPPGQVANLANKIVTTAASFTVQQTAGWF